jgi:hypothetical protein
MAYRDAAKQRAAVNAWMRKKRLTDPAWVEAERAKQRTRFRAKLATDHTWREARYAANRQYQKMKRVTDPAYTAARSRRQRIRRANRTEAENKATLQRMKRLRAAVVVELQRLYGDRCVCCGQTGRQFLNLDHVNGGGHAHNRATPGDLRWKKKLLERVRVDGLDPAYRLLCWNCNCARGIFGVCHPDGPLAQIPPPLLRSSRSSRGADASGAASPQASLW